MAERPIQIAVVGAGFGGLEATLRLERHFRGTDRAQITLVNDQNFFLFTPLLPQIVSSYIEPRHIVQTLRDIRRDREFAFRRDRVVGVDLARRTVRMAEGELAYDYLILALGSWVNFFATPGAEHCFTLKSLADAVELREHIIDGFEHADHESDIARRRERLTFVVVGGGYTGVELVAEIHDFIQRYLLRSYRGITPSDAKLVLLEAAPNILLGVYPALARHARRKLRVEGIEVRTDARVTRCFEDAVEVNGRERLPTRTIIWTAGVKANPLTLGLPVERDRFDRLIVNEFLQLPNYPEVFTVGDCGVVGAAPPEVSPRIAPLAIAQGRLAAANIIARIAGRPLGSFDFAPKGYLVSLGMNEAVVDLMGIRFSGFFAWLLWNAVHLWRLVGFKKQLQVALDWSLATVFPRDAAIVRPPCRCPVCGAPPTAQS